jgi:hypothetical protein
MALAESLTISVHVRTCKIINWLSAKALICLVRLHLITPGQAIETFKCLIEQTTWIRLHASW